MSAPARTMSLLCFLLQRKVSIAGQSWALVCVIPCSGLQDGSALFGPLPVTRAEGTWETELALSFILREIYFLQENATPPCAWKEIWKCVVICIDCTTRPPAHPQGWAPSWWVARPCLDQIRSLQPLLPPLHGSPLDAAKPPSTFTSLCFSAFPTTPTLEIAF